MIAIEVSGKRTVNPAADVTFTRDKGNRILIEFPTIKGKAKETFETLNLDRIMTWYNDIQEMARKVKPDKQ